MLRFLEEAAPPPRVGTAQGLSERMDLLGDLGQPGDARGRRAVRGQAAERRHWLLGPTYRGRRHPILRREAESVSGARLREIGGAFKAGVMCRKIPLDEALAGICHGEKLAFSADEVLLVANRTTMSSVE